MNIPLSWKKAYDDMGAYSEAAEKKMKKASQETSESMKDDADEVGKEHQENSKKASDSWEKAFSSIGKIASTGIKAISTGIGVATAGLTALGTAAVNSFADYEQLVGGIETLFGTRGAKSVEEYAALTGKAVKFVGAEFEMLEEAQTLAMQNVAKAYETAGMSANDYMDTVSGFAASLKQSTASELEAAEKADQAVIDMADNVNKMGTSMELIQNAYQGFAKANYSMLDNLKLGYGGTQAEMFRLLQDAKKIDSTFDAVFSIDSKGHLEAEFADIVDAIHIIQTEMGITGTTAKEATETISGSLAMTKAAWSNLLVGIADDTQDFDVLIDNLVDSATIAFDNLLPRIETSISGIGKLIESAFPIIVDRIPQILNDVAPDLLQSGINMITALLTGIQQNLPQIMNAGVELLVIFATGIISMLPILGETVFEIVSTLYSLLVENLPIMSERGYEMLRSLVEGIVSAIPEMLPKALDFIQQFATNIANAMPKFVKKGFELLSMLVDGIISAIPILIQKVPTIVSTFANIINDNFPTIFLKGAELLWKLILGILSAIPTLVANIPQIITAIVDVFMAYNWVNLGKNIMKGFKDGIGNMKTKIKDSGTEIFNTVKNAIRDLPTTLKNIASNGTSGFANAITGLKSSVINAAKGIFNAVKNNLINLPNSLKSIGKDVVTGLWNGITDKTSWLTSKITSFAKDVVKSAKKALGINSPSKEFAYLGDMCVAGFEQPMEEFNPYKMLQNSMEANIGGLKATFAKTSAQSGTSFAFDYGQFGQEVRSSMQGVSIYMDSRKVGELIAPTVNNELSTYASRRI